jgi:hypothetical protein
MQKVINRIDISGDVYYKVINVINEQVVNINIYKQIEGSFREILPEEVTEDMGKVLMRKENNIPLSNKELKDFTLQLDNIVNKNRQKINAEVIKKFSVKGKVDIVSSFAGITYAVVSFVDKPYMELVKLVLDEDGVVRKVTPLITGIVDLIIADISTKLTLKERAKYIQITRTTIYGIKREQDTIIVAELGIGTEDILCQKSFAIHVANNNYRFYRHDEMDEAMKSKIKKMTTFTVEGLMRAILMDVLKKEED